MAEDTSLDALHEEILEDLFGTRVTRFYPDATSTTSSIVSGNQAYSSADSNSHDGERIYMAHAAATGPNKTTRVTRAGFTGSSGTYAVSPVLAAGPTLAITGASAASPTVITTATHNLTSGDRVYISVTDSTPTVDGVFEVTVVNATTFSIEVDLTGGSGSTGVMGYPLYDSYGLRMDEIDTAINKILNGTYLDSYMPLSLATDAGMNDSGVTAYESINVATLTKETTQGLVFTGTQSLKIATNAAAEGAATEDLALVAGTVDAFTGESITVSVIVYNSAGAWTVNLTDESNNVIHSVAIASTSVNRWLEVRFQDTMETSDVGLKVSILNTSGGGSDIIYWDSHSILSSRRDTYLLPSDVRDVSDIKSLAYLPQGASTEADDIYQPFSVSLQDWLAYGSLTDYAAVHSHRIQLLHYPTEPLWIKYRAKHAALATNTGDTNTTTCLKELVVAGVLADLHKKMFDAGEGSEAEINRHASRAAYWSRQYRSMKPDDGKPQIKQGIQKRVVVG